MRINRFAPALAAALFALCGPGRGAEPPPLTVFAAASLTNVLDEVAARHDATGRGRIRLVFAGSGMLARQIASGAPADLFISANERWMEWLVGRSLIEGTPVPLAGNRLVLIQPADARETLALDASLPARLAGGRIAIGDPDHVPAGIYAKQALEALDLWPRLKDSVVLLPDVRGALLLVGRGEAAAGIVYASDAAIGARARVAATFPAGSHAAIVYPAGVVRDGRVEAARRLLAYLQEPEARAIFRRHGFAVD